jgi:beta-1,4-mannosyl-glycoprotein beta-1,4-N-acetylglucosaminyltransferase
MKIYDAFTFFNELDVLEIRLNVLNEYVDKFILIESKYSHQNKEKCLFYDLNKNDRFLKFKDKIHHVIIDDFPDKSYWGPENFQRNLIFDEVCSISNDDSDIVFISDLDEIWDPLKVYPFLEKCNDDVLYRIRTVVTYHYFNFLSNDPSHINWQHPMFCKINFLKKSYENGFKISMGASGLRGQQPCGNYKTSVLDGYNGWHFSYSEDPVEKVKNFCHSECSNMTKEHFDFCIENKINPFVKSSSMSKLDASELKSFLPKYVYDNIDKYERHIMH